MLLGFIGSPDNKVQKAAPETGLGREGPNLQNKK